VYLKVAPPSDLDLTPGKSTLSIRAESELDDFKETDRKLDLQDNYVRCV